MAFLRFIAAIAAFAISTLPVTAAPLSPGGVIFPTGTSVAADLDQAGAIVNDSLIPAAFGAGFFQASYNVQNRVVLSNTLNTLIFSPRIRDPFNSGGFSSRFSIVAFSLTGYAGFDLFDVDFRTDGLGDKGPTSVSRSADGDRLTFRYGDPLHNDFFNPPGVRDESLFPAIKTNATRFKNNGTMTFFGRRSDADPGDPLQTITITGLATPVVPLPASVFLLLAGIGGLGALSRKRS